MSVHETQDHWELPLGGTTVSALIIDWAVTLRFEAADGDYEIKVEQPFVIEDREGTNHVEPGIDPPSVAPGLSAVRSRVDSARVLKSGRLEIVFDNGAQWRVGPSENFEAWTFTGPAGVLLVGMPGGEVATWTRE